MLGAGYSPLADSAASQSISLPRNVEDLNIMTGDRTEGIESLCVCLCVSEVHDLLLLYLEC